MRTHTSSYSFIFTSGWLRYIALALIAATACGFLASWQNSRRANREAEIRTIETNYSAAPVPLDTVLGSTSAPLEATQEWTHVRLEGTYAPQLAVLARNRTVGGQPGYYVIVPLKVDGGGQILVNRGWVPTPSSGTATPAEVPQPASGPVTVTGWLRPTEDGSKDSNPPGLIRAIDVTRVPGVTDPYQNAYVQLDSDDPAGQPGLATLPQPSVDPGSHLSYTLQWIAFGIMILTGITYAVWRERKLRQSADEDEPENSYVVVDKDALASGLNPSASRYGATHHATQRNPRRRITGQRSSPQQNIEDEELTRQLSEPHT